MSELRQAVTAAVQASRIVTIATRRAQATKWMYHITVDASDPSHAAAAAKSLANSGMAQLAFIV
jgi:hypothetical protein